MSRRCKVCGGEISDILSHPRANYCPACRNVDRTPRVTRGIDGDQIVREYLDRNGWPQFIRPRYMIESDPIVRAALGIVEADISSGSARCSQKISSCLRVLYASVRTISGPHGERYIRWTRTSKAYVLVLPGAACSCRDEVTA
jgi:hypothetical protein